jgi:hypothetical protein
VSAPDGRVEGGRWQPQGFGDVDPDDAPMVWNEHRNDSDDYCGNSGEVAEIDDEEDPSDARCPGGCRASRAVDPDDQR